MNIEIIKEGQDIFSSVSDKLTGDGLDYSKNLIVFPGKRPAYFLLKEIRDRVKSSFIPPAIFSIDEFIDYCYEKELVIHDKKIDHLSGCRIIKELFQEDSLYNGYAKDINSFLPFGLKIFSTLEELLIEGVTVERLKQQDYLMEVSKEYTGKESLSDYLKNFLKISDIYEKFYKNIEERNLSTRSLRYKKVSDSKINLQAFSRIIFAGFFALTSCEKKIFNGFSGDDRAVFMFHGESAKRYALEGRYERVEIEADKIELYECPDIHSEVFKVSSLLEIDLKEKRGKESFLIILPSSDALIPLINSLNLRLNEDYNVSLGYPLVRTPLFSFIKHLSDIIRTKKEDRVYIPDYLKFILHPYAKNILHEGSSENTRIIFHSIEERLKVRSLINYMTLNELECEDFLKGIEDNTEGLKLVDIKNFLKSFHINTIGKFLYLRNIKDFAGSLKELINFVYEKSTAKRHILFFPYCEAMISALIDLEASLFAEESFKSPSEYFDFFKKFIGLYNVPFTGTPLKDIQVLGFLESRNLKFDNVYILDLNEGVIPNSEREDELLPFGIRKELKVPTYIEKDILYDYYLSNIIAGAGKVKLFFVENDNREKSRFIEKIIWQKQKKTGSIEKDYITPVSYKIKLTPCKPKEIKKTDEIKGYLKNLTYSASSIDTYYNCPLMFYYQYVLLPSKSEEIEESLEGRIVGDIIHNILKDYYADRLTELDEQRLECVITRTFKERFGSPVTGKALILKYQVKKQLQEFIRNYRNIVKSESIEILDLEKDFGPFDVSLGNNLKIKVKGRLDRIEKRDGHVYLIDYKKSSNESKYKVRWNRFKKEKREEWKKGFRSIQLLFYIFLLHKNAEYDHKPENASYFLLEKKNLFETELRLFKDNEEKGEFLPLIDEIIGKLIEEITELPVFQPTDEPETCNYCLYKDVCWR
ncbi:MAG: PD-(D/E)XK nuclease family protein [Proteobacteria bacterium]|nr:PD-(D/E)XK nuclease family protein [Pseudomonadota bacterium]